MLFSIPDGDGGQAISLIHNPKRNTWPRDRIIMVKSPWITIEGLQRLSKGRVILQLAGHAKGDLGSLFRSYGGWENY